MSKQIINFSVYFLLVSTVLLGFNYIVDPLQYYKRDDSPIFVKNSRFQIPGLVRNYPFDTIIVGTSHSQNFLTSTLDEYMDSKSINLSISGSSAWEQSQVVQQALSKEKTRRVVWEMNYKSFAGHNPNLLKNGAFPNYLYKPDFTTPFYYLYSLDTLWLSVKYIMGRGSRELDGMSSWFNSHKDKFDGKHIVDHYCQLNVLNQDSDIPKYEKSLKKHLEPLLKQDPKVDYVLFIPPLSVANFALNNQVERFMSFREALYRVAADNSNARIVDFVADLELIGDLKLYKDVEHYSLGVSNEMLKVMGSADGKHKEPRGVKTLNHQFQVFVTSWKNRSRICD